MSLLKEQAARAALEFIEDDMIVGVGTGSTVNIFIEQLAQIKHRIEACVASSVASEMRIRGAGLRVLDLNLIDDLPIYIDGADEVNEARQMIKGAGGALTREKIIASVANQFICIVDESKRVNRLGAFPVAVEVLPMARSYVAREIVKLGGDPQYRPGYVTDNSNIILDVYNLDIINPLQLEEAIKFIPGVIDNGIFAKRSADKVIMGSSNGVISW